MTNAMPSLTADETAQFWSNGYLVIDELFTADEVEALRRACNQPEDTAWQTAGRTVHSLSLTTRSDVFVELARDPRLVGRLRSLIGDDIQLQHSKLAAQPAEAAKGGFAWHQDFAFYPHTNTDLVAIMVMLDDATPDNGCMRFVSGSHQRGLLEHRDDDGLFTGVCHEPDAWQDHEADVVDITPRAGGISMHHCLMLHGAGPNRSGAPRRGLVFQYRADDALQMADGIWPDTGLQVSGERREVVRCEPGEWRLPRSTRYEGHPFGHAWHQEGELAREWNAGR